MVYENPEVENEESELLLWTSIINVALNCLLLLWSWPAFFNLLEELHKPAHQNSMVGNGILIIPISLIIALHYTLPTGILGLFFNLSSSNNVLYLSFTATILLVMTGLLICILSVLPIIFLSILIAKFGLSIIIALGLFLGLMVLTAIKIEGNIYHYNRKIKKALFNYNSIGIVILFVGLIVFSMLN